MAVFTIAEYDNFVASKGVAYPNLSEPPSVEQAISTSGTSQQSAAFGAGTVGIRISTNGGVRYLVGANPVATQASTLLTSGGFFELIVVPGHKLAVIDDA